MSYFEEYERLLKAAKQEPLNQQHTNYACRFNFLRNLKAHTTKQHHKISFFDIYGKFVSKHVLSTLF